MQEMQETRVQSLSWEDPPEEGMATHSSILVWKIPWIEEPGELQESTDLRRVRHDWLSVVMEEKTGGRDMVKGEKKGKEGQRGKNKNETKENVGGEI